MSHLKNLKKLKNICIKMINITKSSAPEGEFLYTDKDIKEKVKKDFFNLCYLCEERSPKHSEIDHFYPQKYFDKRINDWDNLFLICEKCNKLRPKNTNATPDKEVYNNCIDNVEGLIALYYDFTNNQIKIKISKDTIKAKNTVNLLERIYNGKGSKSTDYFELQEEIKNKINHFQIAFDNFLNIKIEFLKENYKNIVIDFISKEYNLKTENIDYNKVGFVSFKRQIIKDNSAFHEFHEYF
jgi:HNH endonuclease